MMSSRIETVYFQFTNVSDYVVPRCRYLFMSGPCALLAEEYGTDYENIGTGACEPGNIFLFVFPLIRIMCLLCVFRYQT